jgi:hypothetical protein
MPSGHFFAGEGPVGVGLGIDLHLPPMNLRPPVQKQLGGVPRRPPEHLGGGGVGVGFVVGDAFCSHPPERVACVPGGQGLVPPLPGPVGCGRTHLPFWKRVPGGQQFGGVPVMPCGHGLVPPFCAPSVPPGCVPLVPPGRHLPSL